MNDFNYLHIYYNTENSGSAKKFNRKNIFTQQIIYRKFLIYLLIGMIKFEVITNSINIFDSHNYGKVGEDNSTN